MSTRDEMNNNKKMSKLEWLLELLDWLKYVLLSFLLGLFITGFVLQKNIVIGDSMYPNLKDGERVWAEKLSKLWGGIERGDIVTIHGREINLGQEDIVKRVIAVAGDSVRISEGKVYLNGEELKETYLPEGTQTYMFSRPDEDFSISIGEGEIFVMGDNRGASKDSRILGPIPETAVMGELWLRTYPWSDFGLLK